MNILIPIVSGILFRLGGWEKGNKWFRWLGIGLFIAYICAMRRHSCLPLVCILTYFVATNVVNYGETQIWRKWFGRDGSWVFYGLCFGLASFPVLGWWSVIQGIIGAGAFWSLMQLSNDGYREDDGQMFYLDHKWVEIGIGFIGTLLYVLKG